MKKNDSKKKAVGASKKTSKKTVASSSKKTTKKTSTNSKKSSADSKLKGLIKSSKRRHLEEVAVDEMRGALSNDLSMKSQSGTEYRLTPKGILLAVLDKHYGAGEDLKVFDEFMKDLCQHLSMLATNDQQHDMFGDDFNSLFDMLVSSMNLSGKMKEILDENGIEFDVAKFLEDINSDCTDKTSNEEDDTDFMPKRKK